MTQKNTIFIVPIEPLDSRYSQQWYKDIPLQLKEKANDNYDIITIDGDQLSDSTTPGAFLDFSATNAYKASQVQKISAMFYENKIKSGDKFLFTDAWHFGITAIRYMSELLDIPVEVHSIWHAGKVDPSDILGMKMGSWGLEQEKAWYLASDYNYFGTNFWLSMFLENLNIPEEFHYKAVRSGQPYEYVIQECLEYYHPVSQEEPKKRIIFTHRLNSDKQPEIFRDLAESLEKYGYECILTQDLNLDKKAYYELLSNSRMVFSCSLHENLGVGMIEGLFCGCVPFVPSRACYTDIYDEKFQYPSEWTESFEKYKENKDLVLQRMLDLLENYDEHIINDIPQQCDKIKNEFMNANVMYDLISQKML